MFEWFCSLPHAEPPQQKGREQFWEETKHRPTSLSGAFHFLKQNKPNIWHHDFKSLWFKVHVTKRGLLMIRCVVRISRRDTIWQDTWQPTLVDDQYEFYPAYKQVLRYCALFDESIFLPLIIYLAYKVLHETDHSLLFVNHRAISFTLAITSLYHEKHFLWKSASDICKHIF